jgi:hypothetical protein
MATLRSPKALPRRRQVHAATDATVVTRLVLRIKKLFIEKNATLRKSLAYPLPSSLVTHPSPPRGEDALVWIQDLVRTILGSG